MVFVAIALRIAITSENISFYSTGVKSAAFCIIAMRIFEFLLMWPFARRVCQAHGVADGAH